MIIATKVNIILMIEKKSFEFRVSSFEFRVSEPETLNPKL
jgi:hypothetical protein